MGIKGRVAITGRPGVGKTTLIERVLPSLPLSRGGFIVREQLVCGHRVGFVLTDVSTGRSGVLAHIHQRAGPRIGRYTVNPETMNEIGVPAIEAALQSRQLIIIDEVAPMEMTCPRFVPAVEAALGSDKRLIVTTHATLDHPLVHRLRRQMHLLRVKTSSRDRLVDELRSLVLEE